MVSRPLGILGLSRARFGLAAAVSATAAAILVALVPSVARSQALIVQFSDSHSAYGRMETFMRAAESIRRDYLRRHPEGRVVFVANGDIFGKSEWTTNSERGWLGTELLGALAKRSEILYVIGNHDGFDWSSVDNHNGLAVDQLRVLDRKGVRVLGSNVRWASDLGFTPAPHFDLRGSAGTTVRFLGYGLAEFERKSGWVRAGSRIGIHSIGPALESAAQDFDRAARDAVEAVVLFQHDGWEETRDLALRLQARSGPSSGRRPSFPLAFSAHDHLRADVEAGETRVLGARSMFDFWAVELGPRGEVASRRFYDEAAQRQAAAPGVALPEELERHREKLVRYLEATRRDQGYDRVLAETGGVEATKVDLKAGPHPLGTAMANALRDFAAERRTGDFLFDVPIGFFNSSAYRRDVPIPPGPLRGEIIASIAPFAQWSRTFRLTGAEVSELYRSLRSWRHGLESNHSPHLSEELRETAGLGLEIRGSTGAWRPVDPNETFLLALDDWLSQNGYGLEEWTRILTPDKAVALYGFRDLLMRYAPRQLARFSPPRSTAAARACPAFFAAR